jgi:hypothetical protein
MPDTREAGAPAPAGAAARDAAPDAVAGDDAAHDAATRDAAVSQRYSIASRPSPTQTAKPPTRTPVIASARLSASR